MSGRSAPGSTAGMPIAHRPLANWVATTILLAAACDPRPTPDVIHTIHTDSAGIPIATAVTPLWSPGEGWTVDDEPLVEIGSVSGAPEYQFAKAVAAVRLASGDIVVADYGASELRRYDAEGVFIWSAGREGEGPGEFESLDFVAAMPGDSLVTYDWVLMRIQVFDPDGRLARTLRAELPSAIAPPGGSAPDRPVGVVDGRLIVRFAEMADVASTGIVRWVNYRLVALDLGDGSATSLIVVGGEEVDLARRDDGGLDDGRYVFFNLPEFGAAAGPVAVIDSEAWRVRLVSPLDGAIERIIRREVEPPEATDAVYEAHLEGIVGMVAGAGAPAEQVDFVRRMWREYPRAATLPVLRSVHVDAGGNIWLAPYYIAGAEPPPFEVFAPDGTWLGKVALPPGLERAFIQYQAPYMEIGDDYVLGVWRDELGVQYVRMYRLNR
ncbi:MAG: hypothetical protein F4X60_09185 [Gemmatimonadetes bacterium]|nr:hypothetical protein [Gemmatimonadota bacterium]MYB98717.1 hypothetical protein [Gemmatimonadota bacterium]